MSSNVLKVAAGAVLALLLIVFLFSSGEEGESSPQPPEIDADAAEAVRQRLGKLEPSNLQDEPGEPAQAVDAMENAPAPQRPAAARPTQPAMQRPGSSMQQRPPSGMQAAVGGSGSTPVVEKPHDVTPQDIPSLKHMAVNDTDIDRRLEAVTLLGASEEPEVIPVLGQALSDEDAEVRLAAIQALADFTEEGVFDLLGKAATDDPEADNRYEALEALSDFDEDRAMLYAKRALDDPDEDVRDLAESLLDTDGGEAPVARPNP